jgi:uncharacterized protein (TIGR03437 family)
MCHDNTFRTLGAFLAAAIGVIVAFSPLYAQDAGEFRADWRRIGNSSVELSLAAPATGPVDRVWYAEDGARLYAHTVSGLVFETADFESWRESRQAFSATEESAVAKVLGAPPEPSAKVQPSAADRARLYALGKQVYRSDDGGLSWTNLTAYKNRSIIGDDMRGLASSPRDPDEIAVANGRGVWRSLDGGLSWTGLNQSLPNLPVRKIESLPAGSQGVRVVTEGVGVMEWAPGERRAWRVAASETADQALRNLLSKSLGAAITTVAAGGDYVYAGTSDGRLWASADRGTTWLLSRPADGTPIEGLNADAADPRFAVAALGAGRAGVKAAHILRTPNGGIFWDDLTSNLPDAAAHGVAFDHASGTLYAATSAGLYYAAVDAQNSLATAKWSRVGGNLPAAPVSDVRLDVGGNQLYAALEGYGVYAAMAPHRVQALRVVNAADFSGRAAAPGSLLSVLGSRVDSALAGQLSAPVLAVSDRETQIQVPFEARGSSVALSLNASQGLVNVGMPLETTSPAVFVDRDGTPMLLDADSGVMLDAMNPAHSHSRIQILATGLGRVRPDWPTGRAAPLENPPQVVATVKAYLDRVPVEVTRATLAPGYIGFYLIEVQLPSIVNYGSAEIYLDADSRSSNRVRIYIEP